MHVYICLSLSIYISINSGRLVGECGAYDCGGGEGGHEYNRVCMNVSLDIHIYIYMYVCMYTLDAGSFSYSYTYTIFFWHSSLRLFRYHRSSLERTHPNLLLLEESGEWRPPSSHHHSAYSHSDGRHHITTQHTGSYQSTPSMSAVSASSSAVGPIPIPNTPHLRVTCP